MSKDRYVLIGNPVAHSKSPAIHAAFARATGQDIEYGLVEAPLDGFSSRVDELRAAGLRGANVTVPFKEEASAYCNGRLSPRAAAAQAVNTLVFEEAGVRGDNTDGVGLVIDLERLGCAVAGKRILLMGAGGAARGVLPALLERGPAVLRIANRTAQRAAELAKLFNASGGGYAELAGQSFDLVINATSSGLTDEAPSLPGGVYARGALAYDMVYGRETPFLAAARAAGVAATDGLGMLVEQAAESFFLWRGVRPQTAPVLAALRGR